MSKTIEYYKQNVYGVGKTYIKDEKTARLIAVLTKKITIDWADMKAMEELFDVEFKEVIKFNN